MGATFTTPPRSPRSGSPMSAWDARAKPIDDQPSTAPAEVGIDLIEIERIQQTLERFGERFVRRVFSPRERERMGREPHQIAARFAAKEAALKALGTGKQGVRWHDVEI